MYIYTHYILYTHNYIYIYIRTHKWQCPSDLLSGILAVPAKRDLKIDESLLNTHLVCFSRHGVLDIVIARILYMIAHARILLMIERGCYALFLFLPESARGPRHLVTRPGPLPYIVYDFNNYIELLYVYTGIAIFRVIVIIISSMCLYYYYKY